MENRVEKGRTATNALIHYGVKGMKWGVRRDRSSRVTISAKGKRLKAKGGYDRKPTAEAKRATVTAQIAKKSGTQALTNKQLQDYVTRMNLESSAHRHLNRENPGERFVMNLLNKSGDQASNVVAQEVVAKRVKSFLAGAAVAAI